MSHMPEHSSQKTDIRVVGLAVLITDRVMDTLGFHLRTKKNRDKIYDAVMYELRKAEVIVPDGRTTDVR